MPRAKCALYHVHLNSEKSFLADQCLLQCNSLDDKDKYKTEFKAFKTRHAKLVMVQIYLLQLYQQVSTTVVLL